MEKLQRFGSAMIVPVLFLSFTGLVIGITVLLTSAPPMGEWAADENGLWWQILNLLNKGAWTILNQLPVIFAVALPVSLAKKQHARCCLEALILFLTFHYFVSTIIIQWGDFFGIPYDADTITEEGSRLKLICGIPTLDMGIMGALIISGVTVFLHNHLFDIKLPAALEVFNGSVFVYVVGFFAMIPLAFLAVMLWPYAQDAITAISTFAASSGALGVWVFTFFEKALLPFGVHHLLYVPVYYDNAVVSGGTAAAWPADLPYLASHADPIVQYAPYSGFLMTQLSGVFGSVGIAAALYFTARPENRKKLLAILVPAVISAMFCGVTEPLEFTFLFVAPLLFLVHAVLGACLATTCYLLGSAGGLGGGLIDQLAVTYIPLFAMHTKELLTIIGVGLCFTGIYFVSFYFLIKKFDYKTPGRLSEEEEKMAFKTKQDYKDKKAKEKAEKKKKKALQSKSAGDNPDADAEGAKEADTEATAAEEKAEEKSFEQLILEGVGGKENITDVFNCVSRLRITVKDTDIVEDDAYFREIGAKGMFKSGKTIQVIIGLEVQKVRDKFERLIGIE